MYESYDSELYPVESAVECRDCRALIFDSLDMDAAGRCPYCHASHAAAERFWRRFYQHAQREQERQDVGDNPDGPRGYAASRPAHLCE